MMKRIIRCLSVFFGLCILCTACGTKTDIEVEDIEVPVVANTIAEKAATEMAVIEPGNIHRVVFATDEIIQPIEMEKTMFADLDGDGKPEMITVRSKSDDGSHSQDELYFQVNDLYYHGSDFGKLLPIGNLSVSDNSFYLVDLDTSDKYKEILILDTGVVENKGHFLRYDQGEMIPISGNDINGIRLSGESVSICGDGMVKTNDRDYSAFQYNRITRTWKLTDSNRFHTILEEVTEFYKYTLRPADDRLTLNREMTFFSQMDGNMDQLLTLSAETKVNIAKFYPDTGWIQFLYDGDTKEAWMKLIDDTVLLPMNIYKSSIDNYISGFSKVG